MPRTLTLLTGGQTGVDRAALDVALALDLECGGWCPAERWAEDGPIPQRYPLHPTASPDPSIRTQRNVRDSDALVVLSPYPVGGGTARAVAEAETRGRPVLVVDPASGDAPGLIERWLTSTLPTGGTVNVAGPRESEVRGIYADSVRVLTEVLGSSSLR